MYIYNCPECIMAMHCVHVTYHDPWVPPAWVGKESSHATNELFNLYVPNEILKARHTRVTVVILSVCLLPLER